ncbi:unnamed protein product [Orchesella dallaii]|uniref:DNA polymerase epsilon catalytic subunit n=1 Tax=Orchesella dallaii TaxID=48710 RepID=A0ABP1QSV6_9HEXA
MPPPKNSGRYIRDPGEKKDGETNTNPDYGGTGDNSENRIRQSFDNDAIDSKFGFNRVKDVTERVGWLLNMHPTEVLDEDKRLISAVDYYFIQEDGSRFKATLAYQPYFYILPKIGYEKEVTLFLQKKYSGTIASIETLAKEDLDLPNHLVGLKQKYVKLSFLNINDLMKARKDILPAVKKNWEREKSNTAYAEMLRQSYIGDTVEFDAQKSSTNHMENIIDIREYDVPYHVRVSIDNKIFVGLWYNIKLQIGVSYKPTIQRQTDIIESPDCIVLAFDIETTKLPLKFPDSSIDQIMMISYMIDGQGYLITNREIVSSDVDDFEYTPRPEFEGLFTIFNEPNEMAVIQRFFDHILDVKPHIFSTYNGDFFDWPFIEARATFHGLSMVKEIGFSVVRDGIYSCRPCVHMDCFNWVKRDSYLPVGSQNLKAVAKAKLRYNPVELDPEDMCRMASEQPQVLATYSVSDAVATYYLYMKYVHPFIFALCTIIPMEADEVLRKGSGTLCETLLMVEAYHATIVFPNKQEAVLNKMTDDGHVLDQETYVGGHVEALESGVFRSDIPCRFKLIPDIFDTLISGVEKTLKHALEEEEKVPLEKVTNFSEVANEIKSKLTVLRDNPLRTEYPLIYHLDVGAMYPNIILTNRLQPSAMVNETVCAACDFNKPDAKCQRQMPWTWRGEHMPASRGEFQRIQQQLEMEKFPPAVPGGSQRAYHQLNKEERAAHEKARLQEYCRKAYKKVRVTKTEVKQQTICQRENSFYVDTVRAFRDRRYEYKALNKSAKKQVSDAVASGDPSAIKSAKNREVLYDSLQLAHKCILNSFYGYVMRRGARWHSMEMAGIVCHTGGNIIRKAREIIEKVGRPLELDTDGIWCMLPSSFPENFEVFTSLEKKSKLVISYPNAVLNLMVKDEFTNDQYHELVDSETLDYEVRNENSIFFEVDGPYLAMILPASKEEGKKLKKRYAVFNPDKSLAELKGFEIKRRGELQLLKNFQSSVFDAFLKGDSLESCYNAVAKVADYWLDVLYTKAVDMPDSELFELISENRSMSRKLEDYGQQKSTSISTAKRLAEFLGDQMVKDAGLSCRFIISKKPEGSPVTERAIPLAIFQAEPSVKKHFLRRWLKDNSIVNFDIRTLLDWEYYIERLNSCIQKIVTIPAALQGVSNPVPRVAHPEWLHKRLLEKTDVLKQRKINEIFRRAPKPVVDEGDIENANQDIGDIEEIGGNLRPAQQRILVHTTRLNRGKRGRSPEVDVSKHWKEVLGPAPPMGDDKESISKWLLFHKKKWSYQAKQRAAERSKRSKRMNMDDDNDFRQGGGGTDLNRRSNFPVTLGGFLRKAQQVLLTTPWHIIQIMDTGTPGRFKLWAMVGQELHQIRLIIPRMFYLNSKEQKNLEEEHVRKCSKLLPRSHQAHHLFEYTIPEDLFKRTSNDIMADVATPCIEGIYETQVPLEFRALTYLGCVCSVDREEARKMKEVGDTFELKQLVSKNVSLDYKYLEITSMKHIFLYQHTSGSKAMFGIFLPPPNNKATIFVLDSAGANLMPNLTNLYRQFRTERLSRGEPEDSLPEANFTFEIRVEKQSRNIFVGLQRILQAYKDEKRGATSVAVQSLIAFQLWVSSVPLLGEFPLIPIRIVDEDDLYASLQWQQQGSKALLKHFLRFRTILEATIDQSRYLQIPVGNLPMDTILTGCDVLFARHLIKNNYVLWCSSTDRPDLGGKEADDNRLVTEFEEHNNIVINNPGFYQTVCIELELDGLAVNTLLQSHHVHDIEGTSATVAFDNMPQASLEEMMGNNPGPSLASYDETALCSGAFRVLKSMVISWVRDVSIHRNVYADYQLMHLYRWLRCPNALLYDPALRKTLNNLMKKLFIQFVAEFMRLGSIIVYADFSRLIICTKKSRVADALGYVEYITASMKNKELFHAIDLKLINCWECLMWMDSANFGGIKAKPRMSDTSEAKQIAEKQLNKSNKKKKDDDNDESDSEAEEENSDLEELNLSEDEDELEPDMRWALTSILPEVGNCKTNFVNVITSYILAIHKHLSSEVDGIIPGETPVRRRVSTQTPRRKGNNPALMMNTTAYSREYVKGELAQHLFRIVQQIDRKYPTPVEPKGGNFLTYVASLGKQKKPALEFIKAIHKVLSMDANIEDDAHKLRRNLLRLIGIGEFSDDALWSEPCPSIVLPEVICKICSLCRDLDICRDPTMVTKNNLRVWTCSACNAAYETDDIEQLLVDSVNRKFMGYVLQDLQCTKCKEIKQDNLSDFCSCGGSYKTILDPKQTTTKLKMYYAIAEHFKMPLLCYNIKWILDMNPQLN